MYADKTPNEYTDTIKAIIEKERIRKELRQSDLAKKSGVPLRTYQNFISSNKITLTNFIKILIALGMSKNLESLIYEQKYTSIEEIRNKQKEKTPKRVKFSKGGSSD